MGFFVVLIIIVLVIFLIRRKRSYGQQTNEQEKENSVEKKLTTEELYDELCESLRELDPAGYKLDWLKESIDKGHKIESNGYFVKESANNNMPYFYETEDEKKMLFSRGNFPFQGFIDGMMNAAFYYHEINEESAHESKRRYWQDRVVEEAEKGSRIAQGALCSNFAKVVFSEERKNEFCEEYEADLWKDANNGDPQAQIAVGQYLCRDINEKEKWLANAAQHNLTDAYYYLGELFSHRMTGVFWDDSKKDVSRVEVSEQERQHWGRAKFESMKKGAELENGVTSVLCMEYIADEYEEGDFIRNNLHQARYWHEKAASRGSEHSLKRLEIVKRTITELEQMR